MDSDELWQNDLDMLFYMGEKDGKSEDYNLDYSWSPSYQNGYYQGKMTKMGFRTAADSDPNYLRNY